MNRNRDELERFQNVITESLQRFLSQPIPGDVPFNEERVNKLLEALPSITQKELEKLGHRDSTCSICIQPFLAILAEEESASVMESPAFFSGELGVTQLSQPWQCGHLFCRRELRFLSSFFLTLRPGAPAVSITKWIKTGKLTCPMCRKSLIEPGSEPEPQPSDRGIETHPIYDMFATGGNADLERFLFGHTGQQNTRRGDTDSDDARHEYSGMYS